MLSILTCTTTTAGEESYHEHNKLHQCKKQVRRLRSVAFLGKKAIRILHGKISNKKMK